MSSRPPRLLPLALALSLAACSPHHTTAPVRVDPGPQANSPANAVNRWGWSWVHRDTCVCSSVFTDDFQFVFGVTDSAGSRFPDRRWSLPDEVRSTHHLFAGGGSLPPAADIHLVVDRVLVSFADPRPGHAARWHRIVRTSLSLEVTVVWPDGTPNVSSVTGAALFYLTRGDSARLSPARIAAGGRDSTRWYIDRWEDQTTGSWPGLHADPTRTSSSG